MERNLLWFTGLFDILNSTKNRLDATTYRGNLDFLKDFLAWFELWKIECLDRQSSKLPESATAYQKMCGFFTAEASDDCISMVKSIIQMTEYYCNDCNDSVYFLPGRISQDLVENGFSKIRLATGIIIRELRLISVYIIDFYDISMTFLWYYVNI